ncbi:hypothetical protein ABID81_002551 [Frigoribacterium sp. PvP054]|uniref:hypothetical protein n=1 Tax=Frigoribacterium sp. PvP054 TaxID=3156438 RepID=UPI0033998AAB
MDGEGIGLAELVDRGLISEPHLASSTDTLRRLLPYQLADGTPVRWREEEVTAFMGTATGALQRGMLRALTTAAGMAWRDDHRLITGGELLAASERGRLGNRNLDLVIARWNDVRCWWVPLAAVEAKFNAQVNGTWKCSNPEHKGKYTNQIICYPMGCGHADLRHYEMNPAASSPFVWLWNRDARSLADARMGLSSKDQHDPSYARAWADGWEAQERYRKVWKVQTWSRLRAAVVAELEADGFERYIIDACLRPLTNRPMPRGWKLAS